MALARQAVLRALVVIHGLGEAATQPRTVEPRVVVLHLTKMPELAARRLPGVQPAEDRGNLGGLEARLRRPQRAVGVAARQGRVEMAALEQRQQATRGVLEVARMVVRRLAVPGEMVVLGAKGQPIRFGLTIVVVLTTA